MIRINKGQEPNEWLQYRLIPGAKYEAIPELRDALLMEQRYICAYCMRRIPVKDNNSNETSRIDHIKCREHYPELELDYNNMVICCPGSIDGDFHCDKKKGNSDISFTPFDIHFINTISYETKSGKIKSSNSVWNNEINTMLNLNNTLLQLNRKQVIEGIRTILGNKQWTNAQLNIQLSKWQSFDNKHKQKEYCGVVIWYLTKKLKAQQ